MELEVALNILTEQLVLERFQREAAALRALRSLRCNGSMNTRLRPTEGTCSWHTCHAADCV